MGVTRIEVGVALVEEEGAEVGHSVVYCLAGDYRVCLCRWFWRREGKIIFLFR